MAELMGERKLNNDMGRSVVHFIRVDQFLGCSGSLGPSQSTCALGSTTIVSAYKTLGTVTPWVAVSAIEV